MAKIRIAVFWFTAVLIFVGVGLNVWLFLERGTTNRALAYACGFTNGQRNIMEAAPNIFRDRDIPELMPCAAERENAHRHGFKPRGSQ